MEENQYLMCPVCGHGEIEVIAEVCVDLFSDNGTIRVGNESKASWTGDSEATCHNCGWSGPLSGSVVTEAPEGCLMVNKGKEA